MKSAGAAILVLALALALGTGVGGCSSLLSETTFASISLGDGALEIRYQDTLGAGAFAAHTVRLYYRVAGREHLLATTKLANDGAMPGEQNVAVSARPDGTWLVTLTGAEQPEERWLIEPGSGGARMWRVDDTADAAGASWAPGSLRPASALTLAAAGVLGGTRWPNTGVGA